MTAYRTSEAPGARSPFVDKMSARRFRFGGEKEAVGAAVAVIQAGIMDCEWRLAIG